MHLIQFIHPIKDIVLQLGAVAIAARRSVVRRGLLRTAQQGLMRTFSLKGTRTHWKSASQVRELEHPFDHENGVQTGGLIDGSKMITGNRHDLDNVGYYGVQPSVFREMCQRWLKSLPDPAAVTNYTFLDLGAGKGRALLLASELPFREIIGIEFSKELAAIAETNIARHRKRAPACANVRVVCQDVVDFRWPEAPLVVYLYNPFGYRVLSKLLDRLAAERGSSAIDVLYVNPDCAFVLDRQPNLKRLWKERIPMSKTDQDADFYRKDSEWVSGYRFAPQPSRSNPSVNAG